MLLPDRDKFIDNVLSYVRFPFDRPAIRSELVDHIEDKMQQYINAGMKKEEAEKQAIMDMGDAKEIGIALNKEHSPLIGWIWRITRIAVNLCIIAVLFVYGVTLISSLFMKDQVDYIKKENIVYHIKTDKTAQVDNDVIKITDIIYTSDGKMHVIYDCYNKWFWPSQTDIIGRIEDDLGNTYPPSGESENSCFRTRRAKTIQDFNENALIINYDQYNRQYRIEISLEEGKNHENNK